MSGAIIAFMAATQLTGANVLITLSGDSAVVAAEFERPSGGDSLRAVLIRIPNQEVRLIPPPSADLTPRQGLYEMLVPKVANTTASVRYLVSGDLDRIPIAVPDSPTVPGTGAVHLVVIGLSDSVRLEDAFPRLARAEDMRAVATLDNVPSFVRLAAPNAVFSARSFTAMALLGLLLGSGVWWIRRRVLARSGTVS